MLLPDKTGGVSRGWQQHGIWKEDRSNQIQVNNIPIKTGCQIKKASAMLAFAVGALEALTAEAPEMPLALYEERLAPGSLWVAVADAKLLHLGSLEVVVAVA